MRWSLDELYTSFESEDFKNDFKNLENDIKKINSWAIENLNSLEEPKEKLEFYIEFQNDFSKYTKLFQYSQLILTVESTNSTAFKSIEQFENLLTELTVSDFLFKKFVSNIENLDEIINSSKLLKNHEFFINEEKSQGKYLLTEKEELVIAKIRTTGASSWGKQREFLMGNLTAEMEVDGEMKTVPFPELRNFAYNPNKELRKRAYETELELYKSVEDAVAFSLNGIKGETVTLCNIRGYNSPLEMTLLNSRMDQEILDAMFDAIKDFLPTLRKFFVKKAELLEHKEALPFYDIFAPVGSLNMTFTFEEAKNYIITNFNNFSTNLGDFAKKAFDNYWIDSEQREGKVGGAFCDSIHPIGESRILTNFANSFGDVLTLAHELGHAYHSGLLMDETYLNSIYTMPIAETASTMCETIIAKTALKTASKEESLVILENDLTGATQVTVDIYSRFLFEDEVFNRRKNGSLATEELNEIMLEAQKTAFGDSLNNEFLHQSAWIAKPHYYNADDHYYNFPYAFGLLFAKGLYAMYVNEGDSFISKYDNFLKQTGKLSLKDLGKTIGIDISKKDFWVSSLKIVEEDINLFLSL